MKINNANTATL